MTILSSIIASTILCSTVFSTTALIILSLAWNIHKTMTIEFSREYGYASYREFRIMYDRNSYAINRRLDISQTRVSWDGDVQFQGKGLVLRFPFDYIRFVWFLKVTCPDRRTVNWDQDTK